MQYYGLDPEHYITAPGFSWEAMLKMTEQRLELISDIDMSQFIEKGMRGAVSYVATRYAEANNKYMKSYDPDKEPVHIAYLDANNLYGWAMSQLLPYGGFKWLEDEKIEVFKDPENPGEYLKVHNATTPFIVVPWISKLVDCFVTSIYICCVSCTNTFGLHWSLRCGHSYVVGNRVWRGSSGVKRTAKDFVFYRLKVRTADASRRLWLHL